MILETDIKIPKEHKLFEVFKNANLSHLGELDSVAHVIERTLNSFITRFNLYNFKEYLKVKPLLIHLVEKIDNDSLISKSSFLPRNSRATIGIFVDKVKDIAGLESEFVLELGRAFDLVLGKDDVKGFISGSVLNPSDLVMLSNLKNAIDRFESQSSRKGEDSANFWFGVTLRILYYGKTLSVIIPDDTCESLVIATDHGVLNDIEYLDSLLGIRVKQFY